jgi:hypothetical protein
MFRPLLAIFRRNTQLFRCEGGNFLEEVCIPPEDGQQGPKHVAAKIYNI